MQCLTSLGARHAYKRANLVILSFFGIYRQSFLGISCANWQQNYTCFVTMAIIIHRNVSYG